MNKLISVFISAVCLFMASCGERMTYKDRTFSAEDRATDLVKRLTLQEKVSLMQNNSRAIPRLGIKPYGWWNEALHGVARAGLATVFPQAIGMGASFNDSLLYEVFSVVSDEARVKNRNAREKNSYKQYQGLTFWTPNVNIFRDPRWGRGQETYGEDPYLTAKMGVAVVKGLQGEAIDGYDKAHACAKHYAVHSGPEWNRHSFNAADIDPRDLWETYLVAFKDLVQKADVKEVMCAYNRFEGEPCCGSDRLLNQILREEWGFDGIVVSDCRGINDFYTKGAHETHAGRPEASAAAVLSGTDMECGRDTVYATLVEAVDKGLIKIEDIDRSVRRVMQARFELGEMDDSTPWDTIPNEMVDCQKHRDKALDMALQSMTLLQNRNNVLPLKEDMTIALIGPNANDSVMQWGNYNGFPSHTSTLLQALRKRVPADKLIYLPACGRVDNKVYQSLFDRCSTSEGKGFTAEYWDNAEFKGKPVVLDRQTVPLFFNSGGDTPFVSGVPVSGFSSRYLANFTAVNNGQIEFRIQMRGACELLVNGERIASLKELHNRPNKTYRMDMSAGKTYNIELKYRHVGEAATLCFDLGEEVGVSTQTVLERVKSADVVVFAGGICAQLEGEQMKVDAPGFRGGDRTDIELPFVQRNLLNTLAKAGKRIVLVNYSGSAMGLVPETESCQAILQAWYPGQAGGRAVADVLFGDYNPAGRLPITFYKDVSQLPDFQDYSMKRRTYRYFTDKPLFPFGFGLSYTDFAYGKAKVEDNCLLVPVENTGKMDGDEVVQLYIQKSGDKDGPLKTMRAFKRIHIPAGKSVVVRIPLTNEIFEWWDASTNTVRPLEGTYRLYYGGSSADEDLERMDYQFEQS